MKQKGIEVYHHIDPIRQPKLQNRHGCNPLTLNLKIILQYIDIQSVFVSF
jgi:hypothetical protein